MARQAAAASSEAAATGPFRVYSCLSSLTKFLRLVIVSGECNPHTVACSSRTTMTCQITASVQTGARRPAAAPHRPGPGRTASGRARLSSSNTLRMAVILPVAGSSGNDTLCRNGLRLSRGARAHALGASVVRARRAPILKNPPLNKNQSKNTQRESISESIGN